MDAETTDAETTVVELRSAASHADGETQADGDRSAVAAVAGGSSGAGSYGVASDGSSVLRIDCADCDHQHTQVCSDCLVTFLCDREDDGAVVVPISEIRAVRLLQGAGLAPEIRHRSRRVG